MKARSVLEVNLSAIRQNVRLLQKITGKSFFCPMLKAEAYGQGAIPVTKILYEEGVKQVGVISTDEAWSIRESLPEVDILIFSPLYSQEDLKWVLQENLVLVCSDWRALKSLSQLKTKVRIHLKFDTGFSRLGFSPKETQKIKDFLKEEPHIQLEGLASQLLSGEELSDKNSPTHKQLESFLELQKAFPSETFPNLKAHLFNSSALINQYVNELDYSSFLGSRPGISLYGIKPKALFENEIAQDKWEKLDFITSSCLKSQIVGLRIISKGEAVSYGSIWKAKEETKIATVSMGYADGFFRSLGSVRNVLFRGQKRPVVGAVGMDFFMIALKKEDQDAQLGEEVIIFGHPDLTLEEQAQAVSTIPYELLCSLGSRVERVYKNP